MDSKVIRIGNPMLRLTSELVHDHEFGTEALYNLVESLYNTMHKENGIGIAAPQIGVNKRLFVFGCEEYGIPKTVLVNPTIKFLSEETEEDYESCLSVGQLFGKVPRFTHLLYKGFDIAGNSIQKEVKGLHARVVQHEYDHLDGILFLDKVRDSKTLGYPEELFSEKTN